MDAKALVMIASMACGAVICCAIAYGWGKWISRPRVAEPARDYSEEHIARLRHLENAVESIAIEVERVGEAQRHAALLQQERPAPDRALLRPSAGYRPTHTPH